MIDWNLIESLLLEVKSEFLSATTRYGPFNSAHEGYAIILEELDELWGEVKNKDGDAMAARKEAIQIAAMALRFLHDITPFTREEKEEHHS